MLVLDFFFFFWKSSSQGKFHSERTIETKLNCKTIGRDSTISSNSIDIYMHDLATVVEDRQIRKNRKIVLTYRSSSIRPCSQSLLVGENIPRSDYLNFWIIQNLPQKA